MIKRSNNKFDKIINNITVILLCTIVFVSSILIGTPIKENTLIVTKITIILFILYIIIYKLILKKQFKDLIRNINLIDISIIVLCLSSFIPIIFKTYVNETASFNSAYRYIGILIIYMFSRILMIQNKDYKKAFISILIISGVLNALMGINNLTLNLFFEELKSIGHLKFINNENKMIGAFGYANTFAISMLIPFILSLDKYINNNKKIHLGLSFVFLSCFILSYSRGSYIVMILISILYAILLKDKSKNIKLASTLTILVIFSTIYAKIFADYYKTNFLIISLSLITLSVLSSLLINLINKHLNTKKINLKKLLKVFISIGTIFISILLIGLCLNKPLKIFYKSSEKDTIMYKISRVKTKFDYDFKFDIESYTHNNSETYKIEVVETDINDIPIQTHELILADFIGTKNINFKSNEKTYNLYIYINTLNTYEQKGLNIKSLKINNKDFNLDYLYLPVKLINRITSFDIYSLTRHGRIIFYKDAFKLIKENPWTGIGGNCWQYSFIDIRSYVYFTSQVHSYPIQIFLEFGIVALLAYLTLVWQILKRFKYLSKEIYCCFVALLGILLHSIIDFDLSFFNMLIYSLILISIISTHTLIKKEKLSIKDKIYNIFKKIINISGGIVGSILLIPITICIVIAKIIYKDKGPIFYAQYRIGKNGKIFKLYKYRSMVVDADKILKDYLNKNKSLKKEYTECKKLKNDPRVTKIGKFIRKTNIDEFPQFLNILKGDMSLIGPRPYLLDEKKDMGDYYEKIIVCKPGITGYWQAYKEKDNSFSTRLELDLYYVKNKNIKMDIKILFKTITISFRRK